MPRVFGGWSGKAVLLAASTMLAAALWPAPPKAGEYEVKAAFLYNFSKFVTWPEEDAELVRPFVIGVLGHDSLAALVADVVRGKFVKGRPLLARRFATPSETSGCDLLFLGQSEERRFRVVLGVLKGHTVLTVGDWPGFARSGGMIGFVSQNDKIGFEVNPEAARRAGLRIGSGLLRLARIVEGGKGI